MQLMTVVKMGKDHDTLNKGGYGQCSSILFLNLGHNNIKSINYERR